LFFGFNFEAGRNLVPFGFVSYSFRMATGMMIERGGQGHFDKEKMDVKDILEKLGKKYKQDGEWQKKWSVMIGGNDERKQRKAEFAGITNVCVTQI
jgi:hypothetical protein